MPKAWKVPKADCALIRAINRASVETTLGKLDPFVSQSRWLAKGNRYAINTISRLALDTKPTSSIHATHLAQYISASSILHCTDGWSYLGRAINCLLAGDPHRVVHLAYYAELRAALSLLASEGVGVFKNLHFVVNAANSAKPLPTKGPTHDASWAYLKYWGTLKRSGDLFSEIVTPGGHSLTTWLSAIGGAEKVVRPRAREWFRQWSMDLGSFSDDKDARNDSSYRPDGIPRSWYLSATDALDLAAELWEACEPSSTTQFDRIDRYILRLAVESTFRGTYGKDPSGDIERFIAYTNAIVEPLSLDPAVASEWKQFLRREVARDDPKIFSYAAKDALDRTMGHAAVLARAMLLLRVATGSCLKLIRSSGMSGDKLEFWWSELGINRGLWDGAKTRIDLLDLWDDISSLFEDIRVYRNSTPQSQQTFATIGTRIPQVVSGLGGCERVAIWSLTP